MGIRFRIGDVMTAIIAGVVVVLLVVAYLAYVWFDAYLEVKSAPREEMFHCAKHGPIRMQHVIKFLGTDYCPTCFHERSKKAEQIHV